MTSHRVIHSAFSVLLCMAASFTPIEAAYGQVAPEVKIRGISVKGNSELPKVLYVVPWQAGYGHFYQDKRNIKELEGTFEYIEPVFDEKQRYFRKNLKTDIQPFSKY
ncbi:MAG: hypothetical protein CSB48_11620 [Proteobacteria bacterium]|nr:MAG: hypothetical protein CSB48_11620 [Pseudomonadota bacterium]PIE40121.1 MAG: hypothetical protein CSA51_02475 [Gammaproteobacteria bacterium]